LLIASYLKKRFNLVKSEKEFFLKKLETKIGQVMQLPYFRFNDLILCLLIGIEASGRKKKGIEAHDVH
jgi:hypothetical protein